MRKIAKEVKKNLWKVFSVPTTEELVICGLVFASVLLCVSACLK